MNFKDIDKDPIFARDRELHPLPTTEPYRRASDGIWEPAHPVTHNEEAIDSKFFDYIHSSQLRHFWHNGRGRFVIAAMRQIWREAQRREFRERGKSPLALPGDPRWRGIDLGGGCGGFLWRLQREDQHKFRELAIGDSSRTALTYAARYIHPDIQRYHVDLHRLEWQNRWDTVFLLDVIEHLANDIDAMIQVRNALVPGGIALVTVPAFSGLWSAYDERWGHVRRYTKPMFRTLAKESGFFLKRVRYFQTFMSPLYALQRILMKPLDLTNAEEVRAFDERLLAVPSAPINRILSWIFEAESPLGLWFPFPVGTSLLGIFQRPLEEGVGPIATRV